MSASPPGWDREYSFGRTPEGWPVLSVRLATGIEVDRVTMKADEADRLLWELGGWLHHTDPDEGESEPRLELVVRGLATDNHLLLRYPEADALLDALCDVTLMSDRLRERAKRHLRTVAKGNAR